LADKSRLVGGCGLVAPPHTTGLVFISIVAQSLGKQHFCVPRRDSSRCRSLGWL